MRLITIILTVLLLVPSAYASELSFKFHSPSFSGQGKSSHYLTTVSYTHLRAHET